MTDAYPASADASLGHSPAGNALLSRAASLQQAKDFAAAEELYRRFLATHPRHLAALNNAALVAKALGKHDVALLRLGKALRHYPQAAEAHFNLANTLQELGRLDEAVAAYRRAIALRHDYLKAYLNLGNALDKLRQHEEAARCYHRALALGGDDAETHSNLGHCYKAQLKFAEALTHFICATKLEPERAGFHLGAAGVRYEIKDYAEADRSFRRVLELEPDHPAVDTSLMFIAQVTCDWAEVARLAPRVRQMTEKQLAAGTGCSEGAFESITRDSDPARNHTLAAASALPFATAERLHRGKPRGTPTTGGKIKLGYLSVDFREHPVAQVIGGILGRHDRHGFDVAAYSYGVDDHSTARQRIVSDCDRFVDLHQLSDEDAAQRIYDDGVDLLVDLTLWTHSNRPRICALRPAAVQIQYLGFPGTSGAPFYDYAIVDRTVVPPEDRPFWSEQLVFMPDSYFVPDRDQPIAASNLRREDCGLPKDAIVFCSFNQVYKFEPHAFDAWMRILEEIPDGVLWLPQSNAVTEANLRREAQRRGISAERLIFADRAAAKAQHLERLALADLALDTLAYNGHTTTSDALWAGVPVVATLGRHFASRVSASLLKAAGLSELIASDVEDYIALAAHLARTPGERLRLKSQLAAARLSAPLFDTDASVTALERGFREIWARFNAGTPPADIQL